MDYHSINNFKITREKKRGLTHARELVRNDNELCYIHDKSVTLLVDLLSSDENGGNN